MLLGKDVFVLQKSKKISNNWDSDNLESLFDPTCFYEKAWGDRCTTQKEFASTDPLIVQVICAGNG